MENIKILQRIRTDELVDGGTIMGIRWKIFRKMDLRKISELIESGNFYDAAIRVTRMIEGKYLHSKALSQIASELAKIDADKAIEIAKEIGDDLERSKALSQIASELAKIDADKAAELFDKAIEIAERIEYVNLHSEALSQIASELAKIDADKAIEIAKEIGDDLERSKALSQIASELAKIDADKAAELFDKAIEIAERIGDEFNRSVALSQIASELAKIDADKAIEIAERIGDDYYKLVALSQIASELAKIDADKAAELFDKAIEIAERIGDEFNRSVALSAIASKLVKIDADKAAELFDKAIEIAERIGDDDWRSRALSAIASKLVKIDADKAIEIAKEIKDDLERSKALSQIAAELAKAHVTNILRERAGEYESKDVKKAIELYESIGDRRAKELEDLLKLVKSDKPVTLRELEQIRRKKIETAKKVKELITKYGASKEIKRELERFEGGDYSVDVDGLLERMKLREKVENLIKSYSQVVFPAIKSLNESERLKIVEETISKYEKAKEELNNLKNNPFSRYLELSRIEGLFKEGKYDEVLKQVKIAKDKAEEIKKYLKKLEELKKELEKYKELILSEDLDKVQELITAPVEKYEDIDKVKEAREMLDKVIREAKPLLKVSLKLNEELKLNAWKKIKVEVTNEGNAAADNVELEFLGDVEVRDVSKIKRIKPGESKVAELTIKPTAEGDVPVDILVNYRNHRGEDKKTKETVWVKVHPQTPTTPAITPASSPVSSPLTPSTQTPASPTPPTTQTPSPATSHFPSELLEYYTEPELIGKGGFARVFRAKRKRDGAVVALKIPIEEKPETGKSFVEEIFKWKKLKHINIAELYDYNTLPYPYMEIELCDCTLKDVSLSFSDKIKILYRISNALSYAHSSGVVHGDLKPSNILIKKVGGKIIPKITDWGAGVTLSYAPPEVILDERKPDELADVWSFGVLMYELITGVHPFQGEDEIETMDNVVELTPDFSQLDELEPIVRKCLEKDRDKRYKSILEVRNDMAKINVSVHSTILSRSTKLEVFQNSMEIVDTYLSVGDYDKAKKRLEYLCKFKVIPNRIKTSNNKLEIITAQTVNEVYRTIMEILQMDAISLDELELKYKHLIQMLPESCRLEFEKDEYIGKLINEILIHFKGINTIFKKSDEEYQKIKNIFCIRLMDKITEMLQ